MANFKTIHTTYGLQRMAQAEATGTSINLVAMAVGDGAGNPVTPSEGQTILVREIADTRHAPNRIFQDPNNPALFTAELVIPSSVGGFTMREIGVFDDSGALFAVGNLPEVYKPDASENAFSDCVVRMQFMVTNANVVTLQVDPNVAVATQTWIVNNVTPATLFPGGLTGQILTKDSNADGDASWHDPTQVNVIVDTVEESQTLAANQTVVDLAVTNTVGLAVYIEGVRLERVTEWTPHATIMTRLTLGKSYPAGTKLIAVQNEPASHLEAALQQDQNLGDLQDKAISRANLDVYSRAESDRLAPVSQVAHFARTTAPAGWLKANGAAVSRTAYAALFAAIGTTFGTGDGFNTFNLPDLRGEFLRSLDDGRGVDAGRVMGSAQTSQNLAHTHTGTTDSAGRHQHTIPTYARDGSTNGSTGDGGSGRTYASSTDAGGDHAHAFTTNAAGGTEARPRNVALLACIKY
jgi:phage-related tail fiber protein